MTTPEVSLQIEGMHCGGCVGRVEKALRGVTGVTDAAVNLATGTARVTGDADRQALLDAVESIGYKARPLASVSAQTLRQIDDAGLARQAATARQLMVGIVLGIPVLLLDYVHHSLPALYAQEILATIIMVYTGGPYFMSAARGVAHRTTTMDTLIALGAGTAYVFSVFAVHVSPFTIHSEFHAAIVIVVLVTLGKYLEVRARKHAASAIAGLSMQTAESATRVNEDGSLQTIPAEQIQVGDRLQVLAHQQLPVDGKIVEGAGSLDLSVITGESVPVEIAAASSTQSLPGGATLADGRIVLRATSTAQSSTVARILQHVHNAQASKTQIQSLADRVAAIFVPIILLLAAANFAAWALITHDYQRAMLTTIATIVIACPCAMGLATPTAITVGMGRAAKLGILFTNAAALETARSINTVLFDKTGTLTHGALEVARVWGPPETLQLVASLEQFAVHPVAKAVLAKASADGVSTLKVGDFHSIPGGGVTGIVNDRTLAAGSAAFIRSLGVSVDVPVTDGQTLMLLADLTAKSHIGTIALQDTLRAETPATLQLLKSRGYQVGVLTGDTETAAKAALHDLPVDLLVANIRPEEKVAAMGEITSKIENKKSKIAFVGDGINDAPALAAADLGIALSSGTDLAKSAGDVLLLNPSLSAVPQTLQLARVTLRVIKQNLFWAFAYNVAAIPLAMLNILPPSVAAGCMIVSSLTVVLNALRLYKIRL